MKLKKLHVFQTKISLFIHLREGSKDQPYQKTFFWLIVTCDMLSSPIRKTNSIKIDYFHVFIDIKKHFSMPLHKVLSCRNFNFEYLGMPKIASRFSSHQTNHLQKNYL